MTLSVDRSTVRIAGRRARRALQGVAREEAESALVGHLRSLHALDAPSVGVFFAHDGEPDLMALVEHLWDHGQTAALPVVAPRSGRTANSGHAKMRFVPWCRGDVLVDGRFDIPIPPHDQAIEPETLLVSLTGFDANGNRMGRGAGFFDRYLVTSTARIVGVGFEVQRFEAIPIEPHDVPLPIVVTDLGVRYVA